MSGIPGYDAWKLATPPEYERDGAPAAGSPERSPEEIAARNSEAYWIGRARGLIDAAEVLGGCPDQHCQRQAVAMRQLARHVAGPQEEDITW